jgi:hypothetical protein
VIRFRSLVALVALGSLVAALAVRAFAQDDSTSDGLGKARFGGTIYKGSPKLANMRALVAAGGGERNFSTVELFGVLAGPGAAAEKAKLIKQFGVPAYERYVKTFDLVVNESLAILSAEGTALPPKPAPNPRNGEALAAALYRDGLDPDAGFNVEYMLDHLVTHAVHVRVMSEIDADYGLKADADYHAVTLQIFKDLKVAYAL